MTLSTSNVSPADLALARYRTLAARLEQAAIDQSWRGSLPASEWATIREAQAQARRDLEAFVKSLIDGEPNQMATTTNETKFPEQALGLVKHLPALDYALLHQQIDTLADAKAYIEMLCRNGLMYHFEDGPEDMLWALPADSTPRHKDVEVLTERQGELYYTHRGRHEPRHWPKADGGCPIGYALICLKQTGDA